MGYWGGEVIVGIAVFGLAVGALKAYEHRARQNGNVDLV
jgi:hypothetical protein